MRMTLDELNSPGAAAACLLRLRRIGDSAAGQTTQQQNAQWMRRWPSTRVRVEGHCDERGTNEYNLALGDSRAASVRDYLVSLGIDASRITAVSRGEESPFCAEDHEGCWSRNRRGHFAVIVK